MKSKIFSLFALSILAVLVLASCVSATITLNPTSLTFKPYETSKTFTITTNADDTSLTLSPQTISDNQNPANSVTITFNVTTITDLDIGETTTVNATLGTIPSDFSL